MFLKVTLTKEKHPIYINSDKLSQFQKSGKHTDMRFDGMLLTICEDPEDLLKQMQRSPVAVRIIPGAPKQWFLTLSRLKAYFILAKDRLVSLKRKRLP